MTSKAAALALIGVGLLKTAPEVHQAFVQPAAGGQLRRAQTFPTAEAGHFDSKGASLYGPPDYLAVGLIAAVGASMVGAVRMRKRPLRRHAQRVVCRATSEVAYKTAFLFPGQGAQSVGMCQELVQTCPAAKELFDKASEMLGYDLLDRCLNGPKEVLDTTAVSQPAIFVASMAAVEKLKQDQGAAVVDEATVAMGLSLGEYSALCFAGALDFEDGVRITKARGEAMQAAADAVESSMVSVIGLDMEKTEELCKKASDDSGKKVQIANYLCKGNYTVSGAKEACAKLAEIAKPEFKARMAVPLAVAGAFHTEFMMPAVEPLKVALAAADIREPRIPVVSNVDGKAHTDPDDIRATLAKQVTAPVMWQQQMEAMVAGGFEKGFECGPGKVIAGIVKRVDKAAAQAITNITV